ncbi:hypothetical protein H671_3g9709 [Cricetulus griseus]|uniref:Uncharacterized protein n=1 Tax=Cricetulus griseus TaxID=10029 RepID=A0A061IF27_CRIGR|nr:hypothetical protein H671_3g9709 [Cricetulus griseus]
MLASACLTEEGVKGVLSSPNGLVTKPDAMFQAVELPAGIADLNKSLASVDRGALMQGIYGISCGQGSDVI